jgi:3-isopropylmalate/(R)-2-methylmalate dehydratase large subunit
MTLCNMSIEGGARVGYMNGPGRLTTCAAALRAPARVRAREAWWRSMASDADARFDDEVEMAADIGRCDLNQPGPGDRRHRGAAPAVQVPRRRSSAEDAYRHGPRPRPADRRLPVRSRSSARARTGGSATCAVRVANGQGHTARLVCPARGRARAGRVRGLHEVFKAAGFQWRGPAADVPGRESRQAVGRELCASSSNTNTGPPGQPDRPHPVDEPGDGRRRRAARPGRRRAEVL